MPHFANTPPADERKAPRRSKKNPRDVIVVVEEAARVGDARFQYFVETGKLRRSE
ncbi:hypothetical protein [Pseudomonas sp. DC3000-4b1]|uniref:hypothetical protein n=1 Tax=unclassified Pseudomonas TaxID=196821 RepID=UPI003CF4720D